MTFKIEINKGLRMFYISVFKNLSLNQNLNSYLLNVCKNPFMMRAYNDPLKMGKKLYFYCMRFLKNNLHLNPNAYNLKILNHKVNVSLTVYYHNFFRAVFLSENIECRIKKIKYFQQQQISPKTNN